MGVSIFEMAELPEWRKVSGREAMGWDCDHLNVPLEMETNRREMH